jgi:hypothetical protein
MLDFTTQKQEQLNHGRILFTKSKCCLKELRESKSELMYIQRMDYFDDETRVTPLIEEASELVAIFTATVKKLDRQ